MFWPREVPRIRSGWKSSPCEEGRWPSGISIFTTCPGARNNWHSHTVGQILLCTEGIGYYQEKGKPAQRLKPGAVVNIPAHTLHWHGAAPDSRFTHIGITPKVSENATEWGGEVTEEEYKDAIK